jgi:hypothetical protein
MIHAAPAYAMLPIPANSEAVNIEKLFHGGWSDPAKLMVV